VYSELLNAKNPAKGAINTYNFYLTLTLFSMHPSGSYAASHFNDILVCLWNCYSCFFIVDDLEWPSVSHQLLQTS